MTERAIAVIGMAARLPGAGDVDAFWRLLAKGGYGVRKVDADDLEAAGADPAALDAPDYAPFWGGPPETDGFDAGFFGYSPREAELLDPQQRLFLECAWTALEDAGCDPATDPRRIGVYAGASLSAHLPRAAGRADPFEVGLANIGGMVAARTAFHLDLTGPGVGVQTTCSSALTATHLAMQALRAGECELALAGAVAVHQARPEGYRWRKEGIAAPDGVCRPFDAAAAGAVFTNGVGVVALKPLEAALRDGDAIHGVLRGSGLSNDGARKVGMTAPGVEGQQAALSAALADSGLDGGAIDYVEAHGTGTAMGDPVELTALNRSYGPGLARAGRRCALGSVKGNVGHLDAAAGMAGLIKILLSLRHDRLPASGGFSTPNPRCAFGAFDALAAPRDWPRDPDRPRRAGLSAFGIGGGNAHLIIEEAPLRAPSAPARGPQILPISARNAQALALSRAALAEMLDAPDAPALADAAFTLQTGRRAFAHRQSVLAASREEAVARLREDAPAPDPNPQTAPDIVFLFPGQGAQRPGMARDLHRAEPAFRDALDICLEDAPETLGLRALLLDPQAANADRIHQTGAAQAALFAMSYALGRLWRARGIAPAAMIGHSVGEFAAAALAGALDPAAAMRLVCARGAAMQACPPGAMLSAMLSEAEARNALCDGIEIAAVNGPRAVTLAGPEDAIAALGRTLARSEVGCRRLRVSHAFHCALTQPAIAPFRKALEGVAWRRPETAIISTLTGDWLGDSEISDPDYWTRQLREPVRFGDAAARAMELERPLFLEVGPGAALIRLARQQGGARARGVATLPQAGETDGALEALEAAGALWREGARLDWSALHQAPRRKVSLPGHPFQRSAFWLPPASGAPPRPAPDRPEDWCWQTVWAQIPPPRRAAPRRRALDEHAAIALGGAGDGDVLLTQGRDFTETENGFALDPADPAQQRAALDALAATGVGELVFGWGLGPEGPRLTPCLLALMRALEQGGDKLRLTVLGAGMQDVFGDEALDPENAAALGLLAALTQVAPRVAARSIDLDPAGIGGGVAGLGAALDAEPGALALRRGRLWRRGHAPAPPDPGAPLARGGVHLIVGDLADGLGPVYAEALRDDPDARLILAGRGLPPVAEWDGWLAAHGPDDPASRFIDILRRRGAPGRDYLVFNGDEGDADWLEAALREAEAQFGALDGAFHVAAMGDAAHEPLAQTDAQALSRRMAAKLRGIAALRRALKTRAARFCLVQSSLATLAGGEGFAAYAAAAAALETAVAAAGRDDATRWRAIAWDAAETGSLGAAGAGASKLRMLSPAEIWRISRAAAGGSGHLVATPVDLTERLAAAAAPPGPRKAAARPDGAPFVAPRDAVETSVARIMAAMLGLPEIGVEDNFFELGGHSLLALQIVSKLRAEFEVELPVRALLLEAPTAAAIAAVIREAAARRKAETDALAQMLDEMEGGAPA